MSLEISQEIGRVRRRNSVMTMRRTCLVRFPLLLPALLAAGSAWSAGPKSSPVVAIAAFDILGKLAGDSNPALPGRVRPGRLSRRLIRGASTVVALFSPAVGRELALMDRFDGDLLALKKAGPSGGRPASTSGPGQPRSVVELGPTFEGDSDFDESPSRRVRPGRVWSRGVNPMEASWSLQGGNQLAVARRFRLCTYPR